MLIVNLTTTYQRLYLCRIALTSLLLQSKPPDRINLWISTEAYLRDEGVSNEDSVSLLIASLPEQASSLVCVRWVSNTGPYRKLIPMLREAAPDDIIVTADDDIFYGEDWLSKLMLAYEENHGMAVASRVRAKKINLFGKKTSYLHWHLINNKSIVKDDFIVTFGGGAVLTRAMFRKEDVFDNSFLKFAPTADDLWYSKLLRINNNSVVVVPSVLSELNFILHSDGLTNNNFPRITTFFHKIRYRVWDRISGYLGIQVSGNDVAYAQIEDYFNTTSDN